MANISKLSIITCNRPGDMKCCLESFLQNRERFGRDHTITVFDNSPDCQPSVDIVVQLSRQYSTAVMYVGLGQKQRLTHELVRHGVPHSVAELALCREHQNLRRTGMNRNAALLLNAGSLFVSSDDDIRAIVVRSPEYRGGIREDEQYDPSAYWFFPSREAAKTRLHAEECDALSLHEELFDLLVSETGIDRETGRKPQSTRDKVLLTTTGLLGDCGMETPRWLWLEGDSRNRVLASEADFKSSFASREVLRVTADQVLSRSRCCMTPFMGFDARCMLPPFLPVGRNEDGIFGALLKLIYPHSLTAYAPWAVLHDPLPERQFAEDALITNLCEPDIADVVSAILKRCTLDETADTEARMKLVAEHLIDLGGLPHEEFVRCVRHWLDIAMSSMLELTTRNRGSGFPVYWNEMNDAVARALQHRRPTARSIVVRSLKQLPEMVASQQLQKVIGEFGLLLSWWPTIWDTALHLNREICWETPVTLHLQQ